MSLAFFVLAHLTLHSWRIKDFGLLWHFRVNRTERITRPYYNFYIAHTRDPMMNSLLRFAAASVLLASPLLASAQSLVTQPLVITGVLQEQVGPSPRCPSQFGGTIVGHGISSISGPVGFVSTDCITQNGPIFNFSEGRFVVLTKSGEQIFANYSGQFVPTGDGMKFVFSNATFQITGGSGRYKKASGGGDLTGGEDMATGSGTIKLNGKITIRD